MLTYEEALRRILEAVSPLAAVEMPLPEALGRVLAEPVTARWDLPPADNSAMDGYAFAFGGQGAETLFPVEGFVPAGAPLDGAVPKGRAARIMTGAPLPAGCDTVVPMEDVRVEGEAIRLTAPAEACSNVRRRGEEFSRGEELLSPGATLLPGEIALLASAGIERVKVVPAPRVALLSTGDELVELGTDPGPGQIVNSNFHLLAARLREEGCIVVPLGVARDRREELTAAVGRGLDADLLLTTGGVSVGDRDLVQETLSGFGFHLGFWKVAIKPGKPVLFGTALGKPVLGLPGNPAASAATFELFARPLLRRLAGFSDCLPPRLRVTLATAVQGGEKRQRFLWGVLSEREGRYAFTPASRQGSGQNRSLQGAQALLPVEGGSPGLPAGAEAEVLLLRLPPGSAILTALLT